MALPMARPWRHPKTGIFWLRKRVPESLRPVVGQLEVKQSLGTRDPAEAKRLHTQALAALEQRWANLQSGSKSLSEREAHETVADAYDWWFELHSENPSEQTLWRTDLYNDLWNYRELAEMLHRTLDEGDLEDEDDECFAPLMRMEAFCRRNVDDLLNNEGLIVDGDSRRRLEFAFGAAIQQASQGLKALARGEFASPFSAPNTRSGVAVRPESLSNSEPVLFDRLLEGWKRERRPMEKTVYEYERAFRDLAAHLGHSDASLVKAKDLVGWKEKMLAAELKPKTIRDAKLAPIRAITAVGRPQRTLGR